MRGSRITIKAVDDDGALDAAGVVLGNADGRATHDLCGRIQLLDLDVYAATLEYEPVGLFLDVRNLLLCEPTFKLDITRRGVRGE